MFLLLLLLSSCVSAGRFSSRVSICYKQTTQDQATAQSQCLARSGLREGLVDTIYRGRPFLRNNALGIYFKDNEASKRRANNWARKVNGTNYIELYKFRTPRARVRAKVFNKMFKKTSTIAPATWRAEGCVAHVEAYNWMKSHGFTRCSDASLGSTITVVNVQFVRDSRRTDRGMTGSWWRDYARWNTINVYNSSLEHKGGCLVDIWKCDRRRTGFDIMLMTACRSFWLFQKLGNYTRATAHPVYPGITLMNARDLSKEFEGSQLSFALPLRAAPTAEEAKKCPLIKKRRPKKKPKKEFEYDIVDEFEV